MNVNHGLEDTDNGNDTGDDNDDDYRNNELSTAVTG